MYERKANLYPPNPMTNFYKLRGRQAHVNTDDFYYSYDLTVMYNKVSCRKEKYDFSVYEIGALSQIATYLLAKNNTKSIINSLRVRRYRRSFQAPSIEGWKQ